MLLCKPVDAFAAPHCNQILTIVSCQLYPKLDDVIPFDNELNFYQLFLNSYLSIISSNFIKGKHTSLINHTKKKFNQHSQDVASSNALIFAKFQVMINNYACINNSSCHHYYFFPILPLSFRIVVMKCFLHKFPNTSHLISLLYWDSEMVLLLQFIVLQLRDWLGFKLGIRELPRGF